MNPINPLLLFMFSASSQTAWGVQYRAPDDDHEAPWLPEWVMASWPSDTVVGPQHPSNLPGFDPEKLYKPVFTPELGWEEVPIPGVGEHLLIGEGPTDGAS